MKINKLNYPAYNEVLGLFALLETPKVDIKKRKIEGICTMCRANTPISDRCEICKKFLHAWCSVGEKEENSICLYWYVIKVFFINIYLFIFDSFSSPKKCDFQAPDKQAKKVKKTATTTSPFSKKTKSPIKTTTPTKSATTKSTKTTPTKTPPKTPEKSTPSLSPQYSNNWNSRNGHDLRKMN